MGLSLSRTEKQSNIMYKYIRDMDNLQATMKRLSIRRKMNNESQRNDAIPHSSYPEKKITQI